MKKIALFDLDGTLNSSHKRAAYIPEDVRNNAAWMGWHNAFHMENLNLELIKTAQGYKRAGYDIAVVSNRNHDLRQETDIQLRCACFPIGAKFFLRHSDDNRHTRQWKVETVKSILALAGPIEIHHFDDDKKALGELEEFFAHSKDVFYIPHFITFK